MATARSRYPRYDINSAFPVCWPVYQLRLGLTVSIRKRLSTAQRFCLQLLEQSRAPATQIAEWMGLPNNYVQDMLGTLAGQNLVTLSTFPCVDITPEGQRVLQQEGHTIQVQTRRMTVSYDPLCRRILQEEPSLSTRSESEKAPEFLLPTEKMTKPTVDKLDSSQMRNDILACYSNRRKGEITEVLHVDRIYKNDTRLMFGRDKVIVVMTPPESNASHPILAVYHRYRDSFMEEETNELQNLEPTWQKFVPPLLHPGSLNSNGHVSVSPSPDEVSGPAPKTEHKI